MIAFLVQHTSDVMEGGREGGRGREGEGERIKYGPSAEIDIFNKLWMPLNIPRLRLCQSTLPLLH